MAKYKILVVEDETDNYLLIEAILDRYDIDLTRAINGKEAVKYHAETHPDIILMDLKLPEMNGLEATKIIRSTDSTVPIIAVTSFAFDNDRREALSAGCNDYIAKPYFVNDFIDMLKKHNIKFD